jgi:hypothetical protein
MDNTVVDVSPSVDGYVAGPGVSVGRPFGGSLPAAAELEQIGAVSTSLATHLTFRAR